VLGCFILSLSAQDCILSLKLEPEEAKGCVRMYSLQEGGDGAEETGAEGSAGQQLGRETWGVLNW
jgi:hypothetical protein